MMKRSFGQRNGRKSNEDHSLQKVLVSIRNFWTTCGWYYEAYMKNCSSNSKHACWLRIWVFYFSHQIFWRKLEMHPLRKFCNVAATKPGRFLAPDIFSDWTIYWRSFSSLLPKFIRLQRFFFYLKQKRLGV